MGKITSLIAATEATKAQIIGLAETKLSKNTPKVEGYRWINRPRPNSTGGGVALLIRDDIHHLTEKVEDLEDEDQEVVWVKIKNPRNSVYVGVFYGPQEKCSNEEAERQYAQLTAQINKLRAEGQIILMGDFNAKLTIENINIKQGQTRNGKLLEKMLDETQTTPVSLKADKGI